MKQEGFSKSESQFSLRNISSEIRYARRVVGKDFAARIRIITELIEAQTRLLGIYSSQLLTKKQSGAKYEENVVVNNTLFNFPYRSLSILLLTRNTFYGSARTICRQFFESLIIAKRSEADPLLVQKWLSEEKSQSSSPISLGNDIFRKLSFGKKTRALKQTWKDLCSTTHATPYSQQFLRIPESQDEQQRIKWLVETDFLPHSEYTFDLLLTLLAMNFHILISSYGRKAYQWWFGYHRDPFGSYRRERRLKNKCKTLIKKYLEDCIDRGGTRKLWRENLFEFKRLN